MAAQVNISIIGNNTASAAFSSASQNAGTLASAVQNLSGAIGTLNVNVANSTGGMNSHRQSVASASGAYQDANGRWHDASGRFVALTGALGGATTGMLSHGQATLGTSGHFTTLGGAVAGAVGHFGNLVATGVSGFFQSVVSGAQDAFHGILNLSTEVAHLAIHFGGEAVREAGDFQASMLKIQYLTDADTTSMGQYRAAAIKMGQDTTFTSKTAADNLVQLSKQHYNVTDAININTAAGQAAMLNNIDLGKATESLTTVMQAYKIPASDVAKVNDQMTVATKLGKLNFEDYSSSMSRLGGVAGLTKQDLASLSVGILAQTNVGDNATHASTLLSSTLLGLAAPSKVAQKGLAELGVSVFDSNGKMRDYADIIEQTQKGVSKLSDAEADKALKDAFGKNNIKAITDAMGAQFTVMRDGKPVVLQGSDALREMEKQMRNSTGATQKASDVMNSGFNFQMKQLKGSVQEALITIGTGLLPGLSKIVEGVTPVVNKFIETETKTHTLTNALTKVGNVVAGIMEPAFKLGVKVIEDLYNGGGKLGTALEGLVQKVEPVVKKFFEFSQALSPVSWIITAIQGFIEGGLNGAFAALEMRAQGVASVLGINLAPAFELVQTVVSNVVAFIQTNGPAIVNGFVTTFGQVASAVQTAIGPIVSFVAGIVGDIISFVTTNGPAILAGFVSVFNGVSSFIQSVMTGIVNFVTPIIGIISDLWSRHGNEIMTTVLHAWTFISTTIGTVLTTVGSVIGTVLTTVGNFIQQNHTQIENTITTVWTAVSTVVGTAVGIISTVVTTVIGAVTTFWQQNGTTILTVATNVWNTVQTVVTTVINAISGVIMPIVSSIVSFWQQNHTEILQAATNIWNAVQGVVTTVINAVSGVISGTVDFISGIWKTFGDTILNTIKNAWNTVSTTVSDVVKVVEDAVKGFIDLVTGNWKGFGEDIKKFWTDAWNTVSDFVTGIGKTIVDTISGFIKDAGNFITTYDWIGLGKSIINGIVEGIKSLPGAIFDGLKSVVGGGVDMVKGFLGIHSPSTYFAEEIGKPITMGMKLGIEQGGPELSNAARIATQSAINSAQGPLKDTKSIGHDLVGGIANGVNEAAQGLARAAAGAAAGALDAAKAALGIHSPSTVAAAEVGKPFSQGISVGILAAMPDLVASTQNMTSQLVGAARGGLSGAVPFDGGGSSSSSSYYPGMSGSGSGGLGGMQTIYNSSSNSTSTSNAPIQNFYLTANYQNQTRESLRQDVELMQRMAANL